MNSLFDPTLAGPADDLTPAVACDPIQLARQILRDYQFVVQSHAATLAQAVQSGAEPDITAANAGLLALSRITTVRRALRGLASPPPSPRRPRDPQPRAPRRQATFADVARELDAVELLLKSNSASRAPFGEQPHPALQASPAPALAPPAAPPFPPNAAATQPTPSATPTTAAPAAPSSAPTPPAPGLPFTRRAPIFSPFAPITLSVTTLPARPPPARLS